MPPFRPSVAARLLAVLTLVGGLGASSCSMLNQDLPNEAPVIQVRQVRVNGADTTRVARGTRVSLEVGASDEDDDPLSYLWTSGGVGTFTDSTSSTTDWIAPARIQGESEFFLLSVRITDHQVDTEDPTETFVIEVVQRIPELVAPADTAISFRDSALTLWAVAADADGDALTSAWEMLESETALPPSSVSLSRSNAGDTLKVRVLPLEPGHIDLRVETTDGSDTVAADVRVEITAQTPPEGGMVALELEGADGRRLPYEIDVYEYPNRRGEVPLLVDSWFEASALCRAEGKRLCTALEWQYACQGPEGAEYSSSDHPDDLPSAFGYRLCSFAGGALAGSDPGSEDLAPSGSYPNCSSSAGVYDMTGNAYEWLSDLTALDGRQGRVSLSGVAIPSPCDGIDGARPAVPYADELDDGDSTAVADLVASDPVSFQGYIQSGRGFRCCRTAR